MDNKLTNLVVSEGSRVQRAFSNAAFFWLDRNEFPLNDFLHACTTHFLLRPDFTSGDAEFILKWIEQQRRNPKSTLNKTLRQQAKIGIDCKDLQVVKGSLKAFMSKPKINKTVAKVNAEPAKKAVKKVAAVKKIKAKTVKKAPKLLKTKKVAKKKVAAKKVLNLRKTLKTSKASVLKKAKNLVKNAVLKNKNKKRRAA